MSELQGVSVVVVGSTEVRLLLAVAGRCFQPKSEGIVGRSGQCEGATRKR